MYHWPTPPYQYSLDLYLFRNRPEKVSLDDDLPSQADFPSQADTLPYPTRIHRIQRYAILPSVTITRNTSLQHRRSSYERIQSRCWYNHRLSERAVSFTHGLLCRNVRLLTQAAAVTQSCAMAVVASMVVMISLMNFMMEVRKWFCVVVVIDAKLMTCRMMARW